jgi:F0F1-type ATP synthase assembly protein I
VVRKINPETGRQLRIATDVGAIGIELAISPLIGFLGGRFLDRTFGTEPWLMYVGLGLGLAAGVRAVWKVMKRTKKVLEAKPEIDPPAEERAS